MKEWQESIKNVQQYVGQLIRKKEQLEKDLLQQKEQVQKILQELEHFKKEYEILEMQHAMLKAAQQMLSEDEKKAVEKKLQRFINEIDDCIALLSR
jgi:hypothetical protein